MDNDRQAYFDALNDLFEMPGWKVLMGEMHDAIVGATEGIVNAPDWGTAQYFKGRRSSFEELATLEATVAQHQLASNEEDTDADV